MDAVKGAPVSIETVASIQPQQLAGMLKCKSDQFLIVDSRTFCEYNTSHILNSINVWSSKIRKKRLQQNSISVFDYLQQASQVHVQEKCFREVVVYDQSATCPSAAPTDSFLYVLLLKLKSAFDKVYLLVGGFLEFQALFPELCEDSTQKASPLTSLSQPCMPMAKSGPTRVLPFLFLGSQNDANNKQLLLEHNISYELNVSTSCPKPEFLQDSHFMRIPVNDNFSEKLLPYFSEAFRFIDKVRETGGRVLVHCLAGISRSPTVAIAFVMKHLRLHYDEAYRYVKNRRPTISPNINFVGQLLELDRQLLGDGFIYRSPTAPLYLEYDFTCNDLTLSTDSLVVKSSSSSCVESSRQKEFPYSLKRSLPSLRLERTLESGSPSVGTPSSPSTAMASLSLFSALKGLESSQEYVSNRLPSTPVTTPPDSPEFFCAYSMSEEHSRKSAKLSPSTSIPTEIPARNVDVINENLFDDRPALSSSQFSSSISTPNAKSYSSLGNNKNRACFSTTATIQVKSSNKELDHVTSDCSNSQQPICVLEVTHEQLPRTFSIDTEPMIVHETQVVATPVSLELVPVSYPDEMEIVHASENSNYTSAHESEEHSNNNRVLTPTSSMPPVFPKVCVVSSYLPKKGDSKPLPRSYSSSETHLNTRRLLESQGNAAAIGPESQTRKSFSSDEVGRGFQSPCQPTSPLTFMRDSMSTPPSELARCDSWSTSGLGSEISDLDSLQEDNHSILTDDTMGPFDAVFADVFPGEQQETLFNENLKKLLTSSSTRVEPERHETKRSKSMNDTKQLRQLRKQTNINEKQHRTIRATSSLNSTQNTDCSCNPSTPRPVSLPGVTGPYTSRLERPISNSNVDMGVEMDDSPEWQSEKGHDVFHFSHAKKSQRSSLAMDSSPRTMSDDTKHLSECHQPSEDGSEDNEKCLLRHPDLYSRRLYREEKSGQQEEKSSFPNRRSLFVKVAKSEDDSSSKSTSSTPSTAMPSAYKGFAARSAENESIENSFNFDVKDRKVSLEERLKNWDLEFKKRIRNIQSNVSLTTWDPEGQLDSVKDTKEVMSGFNLAHEMMQSMENLLETEISDIKRQASELSTKFGLNVLSPAASSQDSSPAIIDPQTHRGTVSFCPTLQQGIVRSGKSQNLNRTDFQFPTFTTETNLRLDSKDRITSLKSENEHQVASLRAKSEPPICIEEGLYRARSCPGIPQGQTEDIKESNMSKDLFCVNLRTSKPTPSANREPKRYSCGALDFVVPHVLPSFESCPDISQLKPCFVENTSPSSGASCSSSTHSSFSRLLQVS